jgi:hypothetical protein
MQLELYKSDLESKLSRIHAGFQPFFNGPSVFHGMWTRQREREIESELAVTNKRINSFKPDKKPECAGPSCFTVVMARFGGDAAFYGFIAFAILLFLWYIDLLGPLWWLISHAVWLIKSIVWFFSNLHELVSFHHFPTLTFL